MVSFSSRSRRGQFQEERFSQDVCAWCSVSMLLQCGQNRVTSRQMQRLRVQEARLQSRPRCRLRANQTTQSTTSSDCEEYRRRRRRRRDEKSNWNKDEHATFRLDGHQHTKPTTMANSTPSPSPSQSSQPQSTPSPDDLTYYTWSSFFSILTNSASPTERAAYFRAKDTLHETSDILRAEADRNWLFAHSPIIRFLSHNINLLAPTDGSASITPSRVICARCDDTQSGGFDPQYGILLCANQMRNRGHMEDTLAHEMVHAYDHLRFKMDAVHNLRHAACTEIRAATLSGECRWGREFFTRGQWGVTQQLQECVRRRAALSVAARPGCRDRKQAEMVVNEVWDSCCRDTRPFDEIYK